MFRDSTFLRTLRPTLKTAEAGRGSYDRALHSSYRVALLSAKA